MLHSQVRTLAKGNKHNNDFCFKQLLELDQEIDWDDLVEAIFPHYVRSKASHILLTVESMLRIYILGRHFDMSPSDTEKSLFQVDVLREFALIDLHRDVIPNASCIADFNSLFEEKRLALKVKLAFNMQPIKTECSAAF